MTNNLSYSMVFTAFFVMLGPVKLIFPFASLTTDTDEAGIRRLSLEAFAFACLAGGLTALLGTRMLSSWDISLPALHLAAGLILLLVALRNILSQYARSSERSVPIAPAGSPALTPITFPLILSPYGIATLVLVLAISTSTQRSVLVFVLFLVVMACNLLAMWCARAIVQRGGGIMAMAGALFAVLQVALAIQLLLDALYRLSVAYGLQTGSTG